ncbi:hypothetical protein DID88_007446 [Monilinia fructigena]|uniref:Myb-like domain-containing protein n=1 Tax=Monilinia fructigena TaxID=38457 RepID=A0A395J8T1_9HELO|nr:hypothetical protein DID88_007446 [Monilinia fructigena]
MAQVPFSSNASKVEDYSTNDNTSPNTVYSDLSTSSKIPPSTYESIDSSNTVALDGAVSNWCSDGLNNRMNNIDSITSEVPGTYADLNLHGSQLILPYEQQHDLVGFWNHKFEPANSWPSDPNIPGTVRPKSLNLNASFTSTASISTIISSQRSINSSAESTTVASSPKDESDEGQSVLKQPPQPSLRYMLPSSRPIQGGDTALSELSNVKIVLERTTKSRCTTNRPVKHRRARAGNPISNAVANTRSHAIIKRNLGIMDYIVPKKPQDDVPESKSPPVIDAIELHSRSEQDEFLVSSRRQGISYKQIRSKGKFSDAESTLRGRFRTLTKDKKDRVRKPKWTDNDLRLLNTAVKKFGRKNRDAWEPKVQWKKVAEYIADNGGSYRFGYATCRKRWLEI